MVTDYKTGAAPRQQYEQGRLGGVHFYSFLCEELFGVRPAKVQLLYLADPVAIIAEPTDQASRGLRRKLDRHLGRHRAVVRAGGLPAPALQAV